MKRRSVAAALAAAVLAVGGGAAAWVVRPRPPRPDVVLFVWDTVRADRLSAYGHVRRTSPHFDALAADGVIYRNCLTPSPWTPPSHASLFTGLLPRRHGLREGRGDSIHRRVPVLAETLRDAGYETAAFSANANLSAASGLTRGFEHFAALYDNENTRATAAEAEAAVARWAAARAAAPGRKRRRPLFLFVNMTDAHLRLDPPTEDVAAVRDPAVPDEDLDRARGVTHWDSLAHLLGVRRLDERLLRAVRCLYDAGIHHMDRRTDAILTLLRRHGYLQEALVVITSDHGEALGEHGQMDHRMSLYEPLLRVPLLIHGGAFRGGLAVGPHVRLHDVYATVLEVVGVETPEGAGLDALPLRTAGAAPRTSLAEFQRPTAFLPLIREAIGPAPEAAFLPCFLTIESATVPAPARPTMKYIRYLRSGEDGRVSLHRQELFDLSADPGETRNLLGGGDQGEAGETARRLAALLDGNGAGR